jgi:hypothetical protein
MDGDRTWPGGQVGQSEPQLAQQVGQPALLGFAERGEETALVVEMRLGDAVDELEALRRERDDGAAAVGRVGRSRDEAGLLEAVQALGRTARREHQRARELGRAQLIRRARAAQRGEDVVPARLEPMGLVNRLQARLELARQA